MGEIDWLRRSPKSGLSATEQVSPALLRPEPAGGRAGETVPAHLAAPMPDYSALLKKHFGFTAFRGGQLAVIESLCAGRPALALFPTGAGKSLCYQLPALVREGTALIVSPLIALMKDQVESLHRRGIAAARLDSTLTAGETAQLYADMAAGSCGCSTSRRSGSRMRRSSNDCGA